MDEPTGSETHARCLRVCNVFGVVRVNSELTANRCFLMANNAQADDAERIVHTR